MWETGTDGLMFAAFCLHFQCDLTLFWERKGGRKELGTVDLKVQGWVRTCHKLLADLPDCTEV